MNGGKRMDMETMLRKMERINVTAELLYDELRGNPRAQVLVEIILDAAANSERV